MGDGLLPGQSGRSSSAGYHPAERDHPVPREGFHAAQPIPEGYNTLSQYLAVEDAAQAIEYYKRAFGATERGVMDAPDGKVAHAELEVGDSVLMLSDPFPQSNTRPPRELGGTSVSVFMYVEDVDAAYQRAIDAGATATAPPQDMFWGDRFGALTDPFGHVWQLATHIEDLSEEEIRERGAKAMAEWADRRVEHDERRGVQAR